MSTPEDLPVAGTVVLVREAAEGFEVLLMRRPDRGSFAGAWVFPGGRVEEADRVLGAVEIDDARRAAMRETFEEVGIVVDALTVLSRWTPPAEAAKRIRTWFFVAVAPDADLRLATGEVSDAVWISPSRALERHATGEWTLFPPTWMTLRHLGSFAEAADVFSGAGEPQSYATRIDGSAFVWDGIRLETRTLPWTLSGTAPE